LKGLSTRRTHQAVPIIGGCEGPGMTVSKNILVVDDSPIERRLAISLLTENIDCTANEAVSSEEALLRIQLAPVDLLLTDLRMPDMDGLELLRRVKEEHPLLPVVVMTGQGTEETAVAALQGGADGYITKRRLAADVVSVVTCVLDASERGRCRAGLFRQLTRQSLEFELESNLTQIAPLWRLIVEDCGHLGIVSERDRVRVAVALEEALMNAMIHGNLEVSSELRERSGTEYEDLIRERQQAEPYASRRVSLKCELTQESAEIIIRDSGPGFDVSALPDPRDAQRIALSSGRGVLLMRSFMDEVFYNESGNEVTLVKHRGDKSEQLSEPTRSDTELAASSAGV
jgi:CheY-like chemotaxis protein